VLLCGVHTGTVPGEATENTENDATNNNSNLNTNINSSNENNTDSLHIMSAWNHVWKDLQRVLHAAPELSSTVEPQDKELMKFPDESVEALAQQLVGDIYMSVSKCQSDPDIIEDHHHRLVESLMSELDIEPRDYTWTVRTTSIIFGQDTVGIRAGYRWWEAWGPAISWA